MRKKQKNNQKKKIIIISTLFGIFLTIWFSGWIIFLFNMELGAMILMISGCIIAIPITIGAIIETMIIPVYKLLKNSKWSSKIMRLLYIIDIILFICGIMLLFLGSPIENMYTVEKVKVLDIKENKIIIDDSTNNHGDEKIIEINKPFYTHIKKGDTINVKYPNNNREKMKYVIDTEVGENLLGMSVSLFLMIIITHIITFFIKVSK